jgi:SAM-dependent methyltransferase
MLLESMSEIDVHPSIFDQSFEREVVDSLRAKRFNPKLLYVTPRQAELWRKVFLRHSPIHGNAEFARIYRDAFARIVDELPRGKTWLVGLGCGTGQKEAELCALLKSRGHEVCFSAVDVSRDLISESAQKLAEAGATSERHLACDLNEVEFLKDWLARAEWNAPRLFTFFGLVPNLMPKNVQQLLTAVLRPQDVLLASANLAPIGNRVDIQAAMQKVLPQYDNPETLAWLNAAIDQWKLNEIVEEPEIRISQLKRIPTFVGLANWRSREMFKKWGPPNSAFDGGSLTLFMSLRYTPELFGHLLYDVGLRMECLSMTSCREEAIWAVRR